MEIIKIPIDEITADPDNAKEHPAWQVEQIKNSIEQFGNLDPIGVWGENNLVVEGNGRLEALKELGYTEAECIRLDWLTEEERRAYALAHNKLTMNSGFIPEALDTNLAAVGEIDMSLFGFDAQQVEPKDEESGEQPETHSTDYSTVHYLVSIDINKHDKLIPLMEECKKIGAEVVMTENNL